MFSPKINYHIIHGSNLNPWSKGTHGRAQDCIIYSDPNPSFTPRLNFFWYVCFYPPPPLLLQPFFGVTVPHNPLVIPIKVVFTYTPSAQLYVDQPFFLAKIYLFFF
jgi:hypothetical protein